VNSALWLAAAAGAVGLAFAAAFAPVPSAFGALAATAACALIWRFGWRTGLWLLFMASVPIRKPLSVDIVGTTTLYLNDLLLLFLTATVAWEHGIRGILRASASFRIGALLAAMAAASLYTATRLGWGISITLHEFAQVAAFYVAWHVVRNARIARDTLLAFVVGLLPAVALGLHQASLPTREFHEAEGTIPNLAWDERGNPKVRIFATFGHPLHFSHALSMGAGIGAGLVVGNPALGVALVPAIAAIAYCNQFTYSVGGFLGTAAGWMTALWLTRRRWLLALVPIGLVGWLLIAPSPLLLRIQDNFSGKSPTTAARMITYYQTFQVLRDHPVFGLGWGSIGTALEHEYRVTREKSVAFTAENYFLERALAQGLVGLGFTIALCVLFFRNVRTPPRPTADAWPRAALIAGAVAFYVQAQVIPAADPESRYVLWTLFSIAERMRMDSRSESGARSEHAS
jgi:hypothetical protein